MKHIYQIERMEEYLPKEFYFGRGGMVKSFLDSMNSVLFKQSYSDNFKKTIRPIELKYINTIRDMTLANMKEEYYQKLLRKYSRYIIDKLIYDNYKQKESDMTYYLEIHHSLYSYESISLRFYGYGSQDDCEKIEIKMNNDNLAMFKSKENKYERLNIKEISKFDKYCYEIIEIMNIISPSPFDKSQSFYCSMSTYFSEQGYIELDFYNN
jgi:hypothetical protein